MLFEWQTVNATRIPSGETDGPRSADNLVRQSLLYQEFQAQRDEILKHKWYESEKRGRDIGFELAQVDWRIKYGSQWRREWQQKRYPNATLSILMTDGCRNQTNEPTSSQALVKYSG